MLSRGPDIETEPYYCLPVSAQAGAVPWSQPTSPTPPSRGFTGLLSPTHNPSHRLTYPKKNDEGNCDDDEAPWRHDFNLSPHFYTVHGSQISLMSGGSSMYGSTTEEQRQANEVRRLKRELHEARDQVMSLSSQLSTNVSDIFTFQANVVERFGRWNAISYPTSSHTCRNPIRHVSPQIFESSRQKKRTKKLHPAAISFSNDLISSVKFPID
jgi:hypothetical protein